MSLNGFLSRENIIAQPGFSRWLVPTAALSIHLCIGQIYAYSVFKLPLVSLLTGEEATLNWTEPQIAWIFSIALCLLGASAGVFGKWVERVGPRKSMFYSAVLFSSGFFVASFGVYLHNIWLIYLGNGVLGGIGLGIGYISPVSTLIKWFPDRPGLATGMAIMGFGGGAMIAGPLSLTLMNFFRTPGTQGVWQTFLVMGCVYFLFMMFGMLTIRVPHPDWKPKGFDPSRIKKAKLITSNNVILDNAIKTPQFYLLAGVLMLNVTAGIGILEQASLMIQRIFSEETVGKSAVTEAAGTGFVGLLSLFNMAGRFGWSSMSDRIGRKMTYMIFFIIGCILFLSLATIGKSGNIALFVITCGIIITMYGGGFATIPAYIRDLFGTIQVGAIHGRILLAWAVAALLGPLLVNYISDYQIRILHIEKHLAYNFTFYLMAGFLVIGMFLNYLITPVHHEYHEKEGGS